MPEDYDVVAVVPDPPSMAFCCPECKFDEPVVAKVENNPGPDRWFTCPSCGHRWSVSPIADSN
jgi:transposase